MGNQIQNAGGLDGTAGWTATAGATLAIDESVVGGPGRAVLTASKSLTAGQTVDAYSSAFAVTSGQSLEAFARLAGGAGARSLAVEVLNGGGTVIGTVAVPLRNAAVGSAARGLKAGFDDVYGLVAAPATGNARLRARLTASGSGAASVSVMKPYLAVPGARLPGRWDPGSHANPDLQLPVWPSVLPPFLVGSAAEPFPDRRGFAGDAGLPATTRLYAGLHYAWRGRMRLNPAEADALDTFYATGGRRFFVVRPDTDQLCLAEWLPDGAPRVTETKGADVVVEVGLHVWAA